MAERQRIRQALSGPFHKGTEPIYEVTTHMTSSSPNAPSLNISTLGIRLQHSNFGGTQLFSPQQAFTTDWYIFPRLLCKLLVIVCWLIYLILTAYYDKQWPIIIYWMNEWLFLMNSEEKKYKQENKFQTDSSFLDNYKLLFLNIQFILVRHFLWHQPQHFNYLGSWKVYSNYSCLCECLRTGDWKETIEERMSWEQELAYTVGAWAQNKSQVLPSYLLGKRSGGWGSPFGTI